MASKASSFQMVQLNLRVNAQDKRNAEEVLRLMGTTTTDFIRKILAKVASGAKEYEKVAAAIDGPAGLLPTVEQAEEVCPLVAEAFAIGDRFAQSLGYNSAEELPLDTRSWDERYEEAMHEHYREKGWIQ